MNNCNILLSISLITYNQENYIRQALDSILMQKTNFKFEILINDDCSTDNTAKIIKEYEQKYPDIIKPIYQSENQFSKSAGISKNFIYPRVQGKYFIANEGDDFFTDTNKLQKQVDFLEAHPECSICFHPVKVIFENSKKKDYIFPIKQNEKNFTFEHLLEENFIQTNSAMYRWDKNITNVFKDNILPGDWFCHLYFASIGKIGFLKDVMSVYRRNSKGIWSKKVEDLHRQYGIAETNFLHAVYSSIAKNKINYMNNILLPNFKIILDNYYNFGDIDKIVKIKNLFPEYFNKAIRLKNPIKKQLKKYKKMYSIFLITTVFLASLNFVFLLLLLLK